MIAEIPGTDVRLPAYARLRDALTSRIAIGEWVAETALPSEAKLAQEYGTSVGTVRKAVDGLVAEGLLERRQGSGTYLRQPSFDATLFRFFQLRSAEGGLSLIPNSELILRATTQAPGEASAALGTSDTIKIVRLRSLSDSPILFEEIYIPRMRFKGFDTLSEAEFGPLLYPLYFEKFGVLVKRATDDLSFGTAENRVASRLDIADGAPVAIIKRTAFSADDTPIEWRIAYGSAERFHYRTEIK